MQNIGDISDIFFDIVITLPYFIYYLSFVVGNTMFSEFSAAIKI